MTEDELRDALELFRAGGLSADSLVGKLRNEPSERLEFATLDHHRGLRQGAGEIVFGEGKTAEYLAAIVSRLYAVSGRVLATRVDPSKAPVCLEALPEARFDPMARTLRAEKEPARRLPGRVAVVTAGTSDIPVAEEAIQTAEFLGATVDRIVDVGVAGLHRILSRIDEIRQADVTLVVAGMEGALPSVVAGLIDRPLIAVPTSVGYGASFSGVAALLGMLNSCGSGVTVVNIDNGFGAAFAATRILRRMEERGAEASDPSEAG